MQFSKNLDKILEKNFKNFKIRNVGDFNFFQKSIHYLRNGQKHSVCSCVFFSHLFREATHRGCAVCDDGSVQVLVEIFHITWKFPYC